MIRPTLVDTLDAVHRSLESAGVRPEQVSSVLLVGGSSRIPLVGQMLVADLQRPVAIDVHPKHAVALGAAHLAAADAGTIAVAADAATTTLEPPVVTRAGRTTVTGPAGVAPEMATAAASPSATEAPGAVPAPAGWQTGAPGPGEAPPWGPDSGGRLPRAGENGDARPAAHGPSGRDGEDGRPGRRRNPLVLAGAAVAAVAAAGAVAVFALGGGGDDDPDGGDTASEAPAEAPSDTGAEAPVVELPPDIPRGAPLAASTIAYTQVDGTFWNVWLVEADGSNPRALTRENRGQGAPAGDRPRPHGRGVHGRDRRRLGAAGQQQRRNGQPHDHHRDGVRRPGHVVARRQPPRLRRPTPTAPRTCTCSTWPPAR